MKKIIIILAVCNTTAFAQKAQPRTTKVVSIEVGQRHWWPARSFIKIVRTSTRVQSEHDTLYNGQHGALAPIAEQRTETIVSVRPRHFWRRGGVPFYNLVFNKQNY